VCSSDLQKEADELIASAIGTATENELNNYGYQLMTATPSKLDEALVVFKSNVDQNPESWNVYDSYAEALGKKGDKKGAAKNYEKALEIAPEGQQARIKTAIKAL